MNSANNRILSHELIPSISVVEQNLSLEAGVRKRNSMIITDPSQPLINRTFNEAMV